MQRRILLHDSTDAPAKPCASGDNNAASIEWAVLSSRRSARTVDSAGLQIDMEVSGRTVEISTRKA